MSTTPQTRDEPKRTRVALSPEADALVRKAQQEMSGSRYGRMTLTEALDWLLRDLAEYGSPCVGSWAARNIWPDSVETAEWTRKQAARASSRGTP